MRIDEKKLVARREETAAVAALLSDIFASDQDKEPAEAIAVPATAGSIAGLDEAHCDLVTALGTQRTWAREELESAAAGRGLMLLDGSIERINDASIEACDEPLIEGDDPYEINDYALEALA